MVVLRFLIFVCLLIPNLVCGQTAQVKNSYFQASFNDKNVENRMHEFNYWNEIQSEEINTAFEVYLKGSYAQKEYPNEASLILGLIEQGGLLGVVIEAHEKWEVLEYLKAGYTLEEVDNGKAYELHKPFAHAEARLKEFKLYQFWYRQTFRDNPPAMRAFLFVHPVLKIIIKDIYKVEVTSEVAKYLIDELKQHKAVIISEKCSKKDLEKAIRFFEKTGYNYGDQSDLFLNRGLMFLNEIG